jgi:hypothetical protein
VIAFGAIGLWDGYATAQTPPSLKGDCNAVGNNNSNCSPYINQAPTPALLETGQTDWMHDGEGVRKDFQVKLQNPGAATKIRIVVHGNDLIGMGFLGEGTMATGAPAKGDGWISHELLTPNSIRGYFVRPKKPTTVRTEIFFD